MVNRMHTFTKMYVYLDKDVNELDVVIVIPYLLMNLIILKNILIKCLKK
jgi:hypothetical protein